MSGNVKLDLVEGPMRGRQFCFAEHDTFLFGRTPDCLACLADDEQVSRHHFLLEVNPPQACLRDLGSLNGTYVNGIKYGGRRRQETPQKAAQENHREVQLKDGDEIRIGRTLLRVRIEAEACCDCGYPIPNPQLDRCKWIGRTFICDSCKKQLNDNSAVSVKSWKPQSRSIALADQMVKNAKPENPSFPGFDVESVIGKGASGEVYLAKDQSSQQRVAIKAMNSRIAVDEQFRKKFAQETCCFCERV